MLINFEMCSIQESSSIIYIIHHINETLIQKQTDTKLLSINLIISIHGRYVILWYFV